MKFLTFFMLSIIVLVNLSYAQDTLDVPLSDDNGAVGVINRFIMGDTTATGERNNPNRVYRLKSGEIYYQDRNMKLDFNLTLVSDNNDTKRPPLVSRAPGANGQYIRPMYEVLKDSVTVTFKNIIFQGMKPTETIDAESIEFLRAKTKNLKIISEGCVYNYFNWQLYNVSSTEQSSYIFRDNKFRNFVGLLGSHQGYVLALYNGVKQDSIIFVNNTFFNVAAYVCVLYDYPKYVEFVHNTIFQNDFGWSLAVSNAYNAVIADNVLYNMNIQGQDTAYYYKKSYSLVNMNYINDDWLAELGITQDERNVKYLNNVYAWNQRVKDEVWHNYYYRVDDNDVVTDTIGYLVPIPWMNERTIAIFDSLPGLIDENNVELDPGFDSDLDNAMLDEHIQWAQDWWIHGKKWTGFSERVYGEANEMFNLPWPLPENLAYTNSEALTAARGGFPAGDLNWFPDKKAQWEEWITSVEENDNSITPHEYTLSQNYPNPFNPTTEINFAIPVSGEVSLIVYNVIGQKVATILDQKLAAGTYRYKFDGSALASGIYFYKLQSENYVKVKKMMLIK